MYICYVTLSYYMKNEGNRYLLFYLLYVPVHPSLDDHTALSLAATDVGYDARLRPVSPQNILNRQTRKAT